MPAPKDKEIRIPKPFWPVEVRSDTFNEESRTVEVCWTSGARVKRYSWDEGYYMEELAVDKKAIRMDRFPSMSLLDTHDQWDMGSRLGTVVPGSVKIENGRGFATIKFSRNDKAEAIFRDLQDGHPLNISVGYKIHRYEKTEGSDGKLPVLRAIDWEPMELSVVPVPADPEAISRSAPPDKEDAVFRVRVENSSEALPAPTKENQIMNKRDAAKSYSGEKLDALALGAGLSRNENEADDALRARLIAAYDAEDKARADAEEAAKRAADEAANRTEPKPQQVEQQPARTEQVSPTDVAEQSRAAVAAERKRVKDINDLARTAGFKAEDELVRKAVDEGTDVEAFRTQLFDKMVERQAASPTFPMVETRGMQDAQETTRRLVANGVMHRFGLADKLEDGANQFRQMSMVDIARDLLAARGENSRGPAVDIVRRSLHSTSDFPIILGDITRQVLMNAYTLEQEQNTFQLIASRNVVPDLREVKVLEMGNGPELEKITEKGEYTRGTVRESQEGFTMAHYGKVIGFTEAMIINDQLGAFAKVVAGWGRVVARLEGNIVWDVIINNDKLKSDSKALFHADHGNLAGTPSALDETNLIIARKAFRKQKDIDGQQIALAPTYLFTGTELEIAAQKLILGVHTPTKTDDVVPQAIRSLQPIYESRIDRILTKAWFLFATPQATLGRGLQYSYLSGYESPRTMERYGFDYDGVEYRLDHYFGAGLTDYRFAFKNVGV